MAAPATTSHGVPTLSLGCHLSSFKSNRGDSPFLLASPPYRFPTSSESRSHYSDLNGYLNRVAIFRASRSSGFLNGRSVPSPGTGPLVLRFARRGELLDNAFRPIDRAIGPLRTDGVVVSCPRLEVVQAHAESCRGVVRVQPDRRFCSLAQVLGIGTIVDDTVILGRGSGVVSGLPDYRQNFLRHFDRWPLSNQDARGSWSSWTYLSSYRV